MWNQPDNAAKSDPMSSVSSGPLNQSNPSPGGIGQEQTMNMRATYPEAPSPMLGAGMLGGFDGGQKSTPYPMPIAPPPMLDAGMSSVGGFMGSVPRTPLNGQAGVGGMAQVGAQIQDSAARQRAGLGPNPGAPQGTAVRGEGAATGYVAPEYATPPGQNFYGR